MARRRCVRGDSAGSDVLEEPDVASGRGVLDGRTDTNHEGALQAAERLRAAIGALRVPGENRNVTASLGVAVLPDDAGDGAQLQRHADRALYAAKKSGRNRVETWLGDVLPTSPGSDQA